jgi:hypothetical protein
MAWRDLTWCSMPRRCVIAPTGEHAAAVVSLVPLHRVSPPSRPSSCTAPRAPPSPCGSSAPDSVKRHDSPSVSAPCARRSMSLFLPSPSLSIHTSVGLCVQVLTPGKGEVVEVSTKTGSFQASVAAEVLSGLTFREVCHAPLAHTLASLLPCWSSCPALLLMTLLPLPRSLVLVVVQPCVVGVAAMYRSALAKPPSWMVCGRRPRRCRCCASSPVRAGTDRLVNGVTCLSALL